MSEGTDGVVTASSTGAETTEEIEKKAVVEDSEGTNEPKYDLVDGLDLDTKRKVARYFDVKLPKDKAIEVATNKDLNAAFRASETDDALYENIYLQDEAGGKPAEESEVLDDKETVEAKEVAKDDDADNTATQEEGEKILLKMTRPNFHFEVYGYTFSKEHPFALGKASDAEAIVRNFEGFSPAMPSELEEYYN